MGKQFVLTVKKDKVCVCIRCKDEYFYTVKEQKLFESKGYKAPKRCKTCRDIHKREMRLLNLEGRGMYYGLGSMLPTLKKGNFRGGVDVRDISGKKFGSNVKNRTWSLLA